MKTVVCILITGSPGYFAAGVETARAVLRHSNFDVFIAHDGACDLSLPSSRRIQTRLVERCDLNAPERFLMKFAALESCLEESEATHCLLMDADAVMVRCMTNQTVRDALGRGSMGMVEQTTICGSTMGRPEFLQHFKEHALKLLGPDDTPPPITQFRYFNSGVVLATREEWLRFLEWAIPEAKRNEGRHRFEKHFVTDQDYFQYWGLIKHPETVVELPWSWNHCEHWDEGFPQAGAYVAHFSNFCNGPAADTVDRMRSLYAVPFWKGLWARLRMLLST